MSHAPVAGILRLGQAIGRGFLVLLAVLLAEAGLVAGPKNIFIETDLEGISGVYQFAQTRETDTPLALTAREYFMGDLAAVVCVTGGRPIS